MRWARVTVWTRRGSYAVWGSDEVLQFIAQAYAGPGDEVVYTEHGFSMYPIIARMAGATPVMVAERDRKVDVDAILAAVTAQTRILFVTNPRQSDLNHDLAAGAGAFGARSTDSCLMVIDGAYAEFVDGFDGGASLVDGHGERHHDPDLFKGLWAGRHARGLGLCASVDHRRADRVRQRSTCL